MISGTEFRRVQTGRRLETSFRDDSPLPHFGDNPLVQQTTAG